jgi:hypothetical protein
VPSLNEMHPALKPLPHSAVAGEKRRARTRNHIGPVASVRVFGARHTLWPVPAAERPVADLAGQARSKFEEVAAPPHNSQQGLVPSATQWAEHVGCWAPSSGLSSRRGAEKALGAPCACVPGLLLVLLVGRWLTARDSERQRPAASERLAQARAMYMGGAHQAWCG